MKISDVYDALEDGTVKVWDGDNWLDIDYYDDQMDEWIQDEQDFKLLVDGQTVDFKFYTTDRDYDEYWILYRVDYGTYGELVGVSGHWDSWNGAAFDDGYDLKPVQEYEVTEKRYKYV